MEKWLTKKLKMVRKIILSLEIATSDYLLAMTMWFNEDMEKRKYS